MRRTTHEFFDLSLGIVCGDIALDEHDVTFAKAIDGLEIHSDNFAVRTYNPGRYLKPAARRGAKIDDPIPSFHEPKALLELYEFVRRP